MGSKSHSPNDQRPIVKNPGTPAHAADRANREKQGHVPPPPPKQDNGSGK